MIFSTREIWRELLDPQLHHVMVRSRPGKPNQRKGPKRKVHTNFALFLCGFWCCSLGKQAQFTNSNFCSGIPLRNVHELTFLWFGLPRPLLTVRGSEGPVRGTKGPVTGTSPILTAPKPHFTCTRSSSGFKLSGFAWISKKGPFCGSPKGPRHTKNSTRNEFTICSEFTTRSDSLLKCSDSSPLGLARPNYT